MKVLMTSGKMDCGLAEKDQKKLAKCIDHIPRTLYVLAPSLSSRVAAANPHLNQGIWTSGASGQALRKPGGMGELPQFPCPTLSMVFRVFTILILPWKN